MNVDDVPLVMQPRWVLDHLQIRCASISRLSCHNFTCSDYMVQYIVPHNSVAVQSDSDWPPHFLFDAAYGCAALKTWGATEFAEEKTKEFYYHDGNYDADNDDDDGHSVRGAGKRARVRWNKTVRTKKADCHSRTETLEKTGDSEAVDILDVVVGL
jgi:hypothetical protein